MKGKFKKPRHKETNRFKFQSFSDRISNIKVDVYHRVKHSYEEDSENETFLYQCLEKWTTLNCSDSFSRLLKDITFNVKTLPQVIKSKERIVEVLLQYLETKDPLNIETVLELVVAVAKDLRQEFYPFYHDFHSKLIALLDSKDEEQLEWTFHCLAYLFKFLWRCVVADLEAVFESLMPLFSSKKPYYIKNFAAESFAFIARKVKDQKMFLKLSLKLLKKHPDGIDGCGRLLFEVLKGIPGQFHSCAETTIDLYLESLSDSSMPFKILAPVLVSTFSEIASNIHPSYSLIAWKALQNALESKIKHWNMELCEKNISRIIHVLKLIKIMISHKSGVHLKEVDPLVNILLIMIQPGKEINSECTMKVSNLLSTLLLSEKVTMTQETASRIVITAMSCLKDDIFLTFVENVMTYSGFDGLVLPRLLKYCSLNPVDRTLPLLTEIVLHHSPQAASANELDNFVSYPLAMPKSHSVNYFECLLTNLQGCCEKYYVKNLECVTCSVIVLQQMTGVDKIQISNALQALVNMLCNYLINSQGCPENCDLDVEDDNNFLGSVLYLISLCIEAILHVDKRPISEVIESKVLLDSLLTYCNDYNNVSALRALDLYISSCQDSSIQPHFDLLLEKLWENLMSPFHRIRLLSCRILYESAKRAKSCLETVLECCWMAEYTPADLQNYREKISHAGRLSPGAGAGVEKLVNPKPVIALILGLHFVNFKLIWPQASKVLVQFAKHFRHDIFWPVLYSQLLKVSTIIRNNADQYSFIQIFKDDNLGSAFKNLSFFDDKPDYINYRILIWTAMCEFSEVCEMKNKDVAYEFITFLEEEYFKRIADVADTWDVGKGDNSDKSKSDEQGMDVDMQDEDLDDTSILNASEEMVVDDNDSDKDDDDVGNESIEDDDQAENNSNEQVDESDDDIDEPIFSNNYKWATKSLLVHLELMSKMTNPRAISREAELYSYYLSFLTSRFSDVQKGALDCIMTYKHKFLNPYRENLYGLIDDKTFSKEINLFRIDNESSLIRPEHRSDLIPVLLRIVSGKMYSCSGSKSSKVKKEVRKKTIVRFLGGCTSEEMKNYFNMSFPLFIDKVQEDAYDMVKHAIESLDLGKVVPPRRLQSSLDLLNNIVVYCAGLLDHSTKACLIRLLLLHGSQISAVLSSKKQVHPMYFNIFKGLRKTIFTCISWFFSKMELYEWTADEINAVFEVFVWPWLNKLHIEGVYSPTPILKLFAVWTENPRYFALLGKCRADDKSKLSPLEEVVKLWMVEKSHKTVYNTILEMIEHLVTLIPPEDVTPLSVQTSIMDYNIIASDKRWNKLNLGSKLMIGFVESILEVMRRKLSKGKFLNHKEMDIMSRVTELITGGGGETVTGLPSPCASQAEALLALLIPVILKKGGAPDHVTIPLLTGIKNLFQVIPDSGKHLRTLVPLLTTVNDPIPRKILISILVHAYKHKNKGEDVTRDVKIIEDSNSYNAKWLDQPDFDRRLSAFKYVLTLLDDGQVPVDLGLIIIYSCFQFLKTEKDLSLRDSSGQCLRKLCPKLSNSVKDNHSEKKFLVDASILNLIKDGIRSYKEEFLRNESIVILGHMVRECSDLHPVLRDLSILANATDLEVDFFENMQHLQHHRRIRAMIRFCETVKTYKSPPIPRAMTQFILPIISFYLCNDTYASRPTVIDAAAQALSTVCRLLPWYQYLFVLKYYLGRMLTKNDYPKQLLRVNVDILNAFHFDLKNADAENLPIKKEETEISIADESDVTSVAENSENKEEDEGIPETGEDESEMEDEDEEVDKNKLMDIEGEANEIIALEQITKLSKSSAQRVIKEIHLILLPQLQKCLNERTKDDSKHSINKKRGGISDSDEQDMLRIPLAVAIVKLLQKQPMHVLEANINGVVMKVVTWLKSRVEGVRRVARQTLQEIAVALGPAKLPSIIKEMQAVLIRGFHLHVLAYSVNGVLNALKPFYEKGHMDAALPLVLEVCKIDLFGDSSEEKEVGQIVGKIMEAKSCKSYNAFQIMSSYISDSYLVDLIFPLKEQLSKTLSHKSVHKVSECLRLSVLGLIDNPHVSVESLLLFAYGTASQSIPALSPNFGEVPVDPKEEIFKQRRNPDLFLIPQAPKREKAAETKTCSKTNAHLLVEFGLNLLYFILKREKISDASYRPHIDPLVPLLLDCLKSQHVKVSIQALKCLLWVMKFNDLPSLKSHIKELIDTFFSILHKYAAAGLSKGDNFELVQFTFKAVAVVIKDVTCYSLDKDQKRILLMYCEQDLEDYSRQAIAFSLLKAIIARKVHAPELDTIMKKVATLSVTANLDSVRVQARQVIHNYIMEYPLGKAISGHLAFYYNQLGYEGQTGRESVLTMIKTFVDTFPVKLLTEESGVMFVNLAARLVNDPAPECRKLVGDIISVILNRIDINIRNDLFGVTKIWMKEKKTSHRQLAAQLFGLFVSREKKEFSKRLKFALPLLNNQFLTNRNKPGRCVLVNVEEEAEDAPAVEKVRDHLLFQVLQVLCKIVTHCPGTLREDEYIPYWSDIFGHAHALLNHPHEWVRLGSVQLLGLTMSQVRPAELAKTIMDQTVETLVNEDDVFTVDQLYSSNPKFQLRSIALDVLAQLTPDNSLNDKFLVQCMKMLVYIGDVMQYLPDNEEENTICITWLVKKVRKVINGEVVKAPSSITVRKMCFNWIAAICTKLEASAITRAVYHLIAPLARELSLGVEGCSDELKTVAREVLGYIKGKVSESDYRKAMQQASGRIDVKRAERKMERAQLAVTDPVRAAKRKIHKQQKKKLLKKRKISIMKNVNRSKKARKMVNLEEN